MSSPRNLPHRRAGAQCLRCGDRAPWVSFSGNTLLAVYKLTIGFLGGSSALIADGCHSAADVVGSTCILLTTRISGKPADGDHPYGHGKAEFIGAVFVYTVLTFFSIGVIVGAILAIHEPAPPHFVSLLGALVSVLCNYLMFRYAECAGTRCNSPAVLADAFENRADALSSVAAVVGIAGAVLIHPVLDPLAAMVVGLVILWNSIQQLREAASGLMDRGLPPDEIAEIERIALAHEGIGGVEFVLTRQTGRSYWVDLGVRLGDDVEVASADAIVTALRHELAENPSLHQVEVFVVPSSSAKASERRGVRLPVLGHDAC